MGRSEFFELEIRCKLSSEYFEDFDLLPENLKEFWNEQSDNNVLSNCEGNGEIGLWCQDCPFCTKFGID